MRWLKVLVLLPAWLLIAGFTYDATPSASPSPSSAPTTSPTQSPSPPPAPSPKGFIDLDVSAGGPNTQITVTGTEFFPHEQMSIYWDSPTKVIGSTTTDSAGNFTVKVKPFAGDQPGLHHICASVPPNPCAQFQLQGPPTPTPSTAATPSESPSPSASPSESPSPSPSPVPIPVANNNTSGLDTLLQPPFIFLPFIAALALLVAIAYWYFGATRERGALPSASVTHRSGPGHGLSDYDIRPAPLGPTPGETRPPSPPGPREPDQTPPTPEG